MLELFIGLIVVAGIAGDVYLAKKYPVYKKFIITFTAVFFGIVLTWGIGYVILEIANAL